MPVTMPAFWKSTGKVSIAPPIIELSKVKIVVMELLVCVDMVSKGDGSFFYELKQLYLLKIY